MTTIEAATRMGYLTATSPVGPPVCESWCGNGTPPLEVAGYGFVVAIGGELERFKLSGRSMLLWDYSIAWCSHDCREKHIVGIGLESAPTADRSRCKAPAWCGYVYDKGTYGFSAYKNNPVSHYGGYCSEACEQASRRHSLAATPAASNPEFIRTWRCAFGSDHPEGNNCAPWNCPRRWLAATTEPIPIPCPSCLRADLSQCTPPDGICKHATPDKRPAAKPAKPVCRLLGIGPHACSGDVAERVLPRLPRGLYCVQAMMTREASVAQCTQRSGTGVPLDKDRPDLIPRRLAHSFGIEDPALENC